MPKKTKPEVPPPEDEAAPPERFVEFIRRIIAVPKEEIQKTRKPRQHAERAS